MTRWLILVNGSFGFGANLTSIELCSTIFSVLRNPSRVRTHLTRALYADLVGPHQGAKVHSTSTEILPTRPSSWYLTGFLVPDKDRVIEPDVLEGLGTGDDIQTEESSAEEHEPKQKKLFPASMGMSVLLPEEARAVTAQVSFAQYFACDDGGAPWKTGSKKRWCRRPHAQVEIELALDSAMLQRGYAVPSVPGVWLIGRLSTFERELASVAAGTKALSLFVVNRQATDADRRDESILFQVQLALRSQSGFIPRPNIRGQSSDDFDARTMDLHYRNRFEYAVGHNVAVEPVIKPERGEHNVLEVRTRWIPGVEVRSVRAGQIDGVEVKMEALAGIKSSDEVYAALHKLPEAYLLWIELQAKEKLSKDRTATRHELLIQARKACARIQSGIDLLKTDSQVRRAFNLANKAMAMAARRRSPERYEAGAAPEWRLFQLAFVLINLAGIADPTHEDRKTVELIFFPTGGGKTEAYLGVAAFAMLLRRMRGANEPHQGLGVAVLLRYTLRLLTLDQLERATALVCALEVLRRLQPAELGKVRFAAGLWVGQSTTSNRLADFVEANENFKNKRRETSPVPIELCPWCKKPLTAGSVEVRPNQRNPERIIVRCMNSGKCEFANPEPDGLPLVFVDEQIYSELPAFLIATVDKFAMMPWRGEAGLLFGRATHMHDGRFYGPLDKRPQGVELPNGLLPPDVIVQDELHLITGPLGTMVGLYEVALELLASRQIGGKQVHPKIIASTATANHAHDQIEKLYGSDKVTAVFPPPALDALETFFSEVNEQGPGRLYVGVAAPGHPLKRVLLRTYVSLLTAARKVADTAEDPQLADAYMSLIGYFNALRELGGMRRLVEDDVRTWCKNHAERVPLNERGSSPWFSARSVSEPLELTSRESTGGITKTKDRLSRSHAADNATDVVLATNMISVGIDIERLGLLVVAGQPKTTSEYIQATSRVGRDANRPGLES
jgi:hypothetical protein